MLGRPCWLSQSSEMKHLRTLHHRTMNRWNQQSGQQVLGHFWGFPAPCFLETYIGGLRPNGQFHDIGDIETVGHAFAEGSAGCGRACPSGCLWNPCLSPGFAKGGMCGKLQLNGITNLFIITIIWEITLSIPYWLGSIFWGSEILIFLAESEINILYWYFSW